MSTFIPSLPERKDSCKVKFTNWDKTVECKPHTNLRQLAIDNDIDLYNGMTRFFNCEGNGLCGTCTVEVSPPDGISIKGAYEKFRFLLLKGNLRFACQAEVVGDIEVTKHKGIKGNRGYKELLPKEEIVQLYESGKTVTELSEQFNCPPAKIAVIFEQAGVKMRQPGSAA